MSETNGHSQALLVSLHFKMCRQTRQSRAEAENVEERNHAADGTTRVSYYYFQQRIGKEIRDALANIKSHFGAWGTEHRRLTRGWDTGSARLLAPTLAAQYLERMDDFERAAPAVLAEFFEAYSDWQVTAPQRMGHLYSEADFPTLENCRESIGWERSMIPLPEAEQWRKISMISPNLAATMESQTNQQIARAVELAKAQTCQELIEPIEKIITVCSNDKSKLFDTLIGNLNRVLDIAPAYSSGDQTLLNFIAEARTTLGTVNVDDLRADASLRTIVARNAQDLLSRFGQLGGRKLA